MYTLWPSEVRKLMFAGEVVPKSSTRRLSLAFRIRKHVGPAARRSYPVRAVPASSLRAILAKSAEHRSSLVLNGLASTALYLKNINGFPCGPLTALVRLIAE